MPVGLRAAMVEGRIAGCPEHDPRMAAALRRFHVVRELSTVGSDSSGLPGLMVRNMLMSAAGIAHNMLLR
jgi:hypothetical protein